MEKGINRLAIMIIMFMFAFTFEISAHANPNGSDSITKEEQLYDDGLQLGEKMNRIALAGYELGKSGAEYKLPTKYQKSKNIFQYYYNKGLKEYKFEKKNHIKIANAGAGLLFLIWLCRRFYVAKKMIC